MTATVWVYTTEENSRKWEKEADERDMSMSSFAEAMIEAGRKGVSLNFSFDQKPVELRNQRNDLKEENERLRSRLEQLQNRALKQEKELVLDHIAENPGVTYREITQHLIETTPTRVNEYIDYLLGDEVTSQDGQYYRINGSDEEGDW